MKSLKLRLSHHKDWWIDDDAAWICAVELGQIFDLKGATEIEIAFTKTKSRGAPSITDYDGEEWAWLVDGVLKNLTGDLDSLLLKVRGKRNVPLYATVWILEETDG